MDFRGVNEFSLSPVDEKNIFLSILETYSSLS